MDLQSLSLPSSSSDDKRFPNERQVGFWKSDTVLDQHAHTKPVASSTIEKIIPVESQRTKYLEHTETFTKQDQNVNLCIDSQAVGAERVPDRSLNLLRPIKQGPGKKLSFNGDHGFHVAEGSTVNTMTSHYENSLFSRSFSELFTRKLRLSSNNALHGHSIDAVATNYDEEEPFESLEELEAQTIGNLLPNDDDLFSGVTEGLDFIVLPNVSEEVEELDVFSSVGGMDLGDDDFTVVQKNSEFPGENHQGLSNGLVAGEHPCGEHPSRTLFVRNINSNVEDSELKALFEQYGDIRTLYTACKHRGFVMISYYDIRAARNAMKALQNRPFRRRKLDIHYSIPKDNPSENDENQSTLVVFNLDASVSNIELRHIFGAYGEIKEIRETPQRSQHKFIEFYDVRAAEAALHSLNGSDIAGKRIKVEPSHPGCSRTCLVRQLPLEERDELCPYEHLHSPSNKATVAFPVRANSSINMANGISSVVNSAIQARFLESTIHHGISSGVSNSLMSTARVGSIGNQSVIAESGHLQGQLTFDAQGASSFHSRSLPEFQNGLCSGVLSNSSGPMVANINSKPLEIIDNRPLSRINSNGHSFEFSKAGFPSAGNVSHLLPGHHYSWSNSYHQPPSMMWPNSPSLVTGTCGAHPTARLHGLPRAPSHILNVGVPINNSHVGSAPTVTPLWDRRHAYAGESPEASTFRPGSLGSMRGANNLSHSMEFVPHNIFPYVGGNCMDVSVSQKNVGLQLLHPRFSAYTRRGQIIPILNSVDSPQEGTRSQMNDSSINQGDKKQFELDIDRIIQGEDKRTTLMLKNIPNKYTSKMLLAAIDERHRGSYDFIYLPIDFKNKCNVGYAFINMIDPSQIITFYQAFNGKKWEKFNSEKVASLAYARIQGKAALVAHFQNSSLMNEDKRCRPILFNTDGPNAGDQVPFPMGVNVRTRSGKARSTGHEGNNQESPSNTENEENSSNGETCSSKQSG
ncbi:LOW QUALITY PROTEIN: protein MEI2-like 4 [Durio zibethinus]|uniref:LOW QUALITY PROTEIN: protein MEI2-like 4 n=1 Tax=Durio zibethinus TaxID=66656 RepID=A0A6P5XDI9_DURZI|nr:LOW QUALITY PROTEIN: protein MEI2-like 4 [Durio zibethinus]